MTYSRYEKSFSRIRATWRELAQSIVLNGDYCKYDNMLTALMDDINEIDSAADEAVNRLELELHAVKTERGI